MADRTLRDMETRETEVRVWKPPSLLPDPTPEAGYRFRWVRHSLANQNDQSHMSSMLRQGFEPVRAEDHPELRLYSEKDGRFPGAVEVGGLVLCKVPLEIANQRNAHYRTVADAQMTAVENNLMRENDPRMPLLRPERSSKTTFGSGR